MKKTIAILQVVAILFFNSWSLKSVLADDSDIFGYNVKPNVLLALTSSTNMNDPIMSAAYDPNATYSTPLTYTTGNVFKWLNSTPGCKPQPKPCYTKYANSISLVSDSGARNALQTVGYWTGSINGSNVSLYHGNYLNYTLCSSCGAMQSKISIAKTVLTNLINNTVGLRFGATKYAAGGGLVLEPIRDMTTSNQAQLVNSIKNMPLDSSGNPLGPQLHHAGDYFEGNLTGLPSPIQYACQPNFVIAITDGASTGTNPVLDATDLYTKDHSSTFAGTQNVITHVVAFGLPQADKDAGAIQALRQVATAGGGSFFQAENAAQLELALQSVISQILAATFSFATPVVPTTGTASTLRAYLASFQSNPSRPYWLGFLKAFNRDANGLIQVDAQGIPLASTLAWDAGQVLSTHSAGARTIKTYIGGAMQDFASTTSALTSTVLAVDNPPFPLLATTASEARDKVINFSRGTPDTNDEDGDTDVTEPRPWKLGDIFHSTPVLVTPPFLVSKDATYNAFKTSNAGRTAVLLAGANDGMLHAFREADGVELWGFIPPDQLDDLKDLASVTGLHDFLVDGSPIAADVKIGATPAWKTIVMFGLRRGGKHYYALDITDTTNPQYLWSFTDAKMGETWSEPAIGKIKLSDGTSKYVAFIGGGYDTAANNNSGKAFYVIDVETGAKLWEYFNTGSASDDRQYMNFSLAISPTAVDLNGDGHVDRIYIGDIGGQMWKFDISTPAIIAGGVITNWSAAQTGKRFFVGAPSQPNPPASGEYYPAQAIYAPPALAYDANKSLWVYFGTGDRNHPNAPSSNRFYAVKDTTEVNGAAIMTQGSYFQESSLVNVTSGNGNVTQGYYIALGSNEKVLAAVDVFSSVVFYTTYTPSSVVQCNGGSGIAKLYSVNLTTGDAALDLTTGGVLPAGTAAVAAAKTIGTGIPSRPVVTIDQN
ncbi:MAG: PilC/PilY family type IV pilus protein, partial [Deltaproteobacteria bacterium]|nr:PilC/PilY family type IV pilus protein [Deltaproteobacteria bacterium]